MAIATVGCAVDLITKSRVFAWLGPPPSGVWWIWPEYIGFETSINTGALFGMGQGRTESLVVVSLVALVGIAYWLFWAGATRDLLVSIALGLILGGILGNLYDRLGWWGVRGVRDWILFRYGQFTWPNFNVADSLLVAGACLLAYHAFRPVPPPPAAT